MKHLDGNIAVKEVIEFLNSKRVMPYTTCTSNNAPYGSSMVPGTSGKIQLLDCTVILASGSNDVMGDPIKKSLNVNGRNVKFDTIGIAAVRLNENGEVEAIAGGGLKLFETDDIKIELPSRTDIVLWRDLKGEWHGVLHGFEGLVPDELTRITTDWLNVSVSAALKE